MIGISMDIPSPHARLDRTTLNAGDLLEVSVKVTNFGPFEGDETVEAYLIPRNQPGAPQHALVGFQKVHLAKGGTATAHISINARQLSLVAPDGSRSIRPGDYELHVGGSQPTERDGQRLPFRIDGSIAINP